MTTSNPPPKRKIFFSYRRSDHADFVERVRDWFAWRYGRDSVFMDFDTIPPFTRFADFIRQKVAECDVLVAVIGPRWMDTLRERLSDSEDDYVRIEIRLALEEGKPIAPICIKGAEAPRRHDLPPDLQPMMDYHVAYLDAGRHFLDNIEPILDALEQQLADLDGLRLVNQEIHKVEPAGFNLREAIANFQAAEDANDWTGALKWLDRIRKSGYMPRFYPLDDYERDIRDKQSIDKAAREYDALRHMAERAASGREDKARIWDALEDFWESYPGYDPDNLAARLQIPQDVTAEIIPSMEVVYKPIVLHSLDSISFDQDLVDSEALDVLFSPDTLAQIPERQRVSDNTISFEDAQQLGLVPDV
jgi:hypothetical protein